MKNNASRKIIKGLWISAIGIFALIGFALTSAFFAVKFHLTDDPGVVDLNDRYFQEISNQYGKEKENSGTDTTSLSEARLFYNLAVLSKYYPSNAYLIENAYLKSKNLAEAQSMIKAAEIYLREDSFYQAELSNFDQMSASKVKVQTKSIFEWMNIPEWQVFKQAVSKDKYLIDSVANLTKVEPRLIVAVLVGEQIRLFNSSREAYKKWIGPLKILSVETTFSLGVTGIKVPTAQTIEKNLKDSNSVFYLGKEYENLLDFKTKDHASERFKRLTDYHNHFYSYMYAALNIKQMKVQWERSGFPITERPEIIATLYNIGFESSVPKAEPVVGGSGINIKGKKYSFGAIAYEFYYSGELFDEFPFKNSKFDFADV